MLKRCCASLSRGLKSFFSTSSNAASKIPESNVVDQQMQKAKDIFQAAVQSVLPSSLIPRKISRHDQILRIERQLEVPLNDFKRCFVVGFGKAVLPMAEEVAGILGPYMTKCIVSVPEGTRETHVPSLEVYRGAPNNIPDFDSFNSAGHIVKLVQSCNGDDLVIVLISGGGSALLPYPKPPITIREKREVVKRIMLTGCNINDLNKVRKKISLVKGGGLAQICKARLMIGIILSDVLGDPLDVIASGTTVENSDGDDDALEVLERLDIKLNTLPQSVQKVLKEKTVRNPRDFAHVRNFIIGNNRVALNAAGDKARELNYVPIILSSMLQGRARVVGEKLALLSCIVAHYSHVDTEHLRNAVHDLNLKDLRTPGLIIESIKKIREIEKGPLCLLLGGETTVKVKGSGVGGRNQELALSCAIKLNELRPKHPITILSAGTDGIDGPCPTAGAMITVKTIDDAKAAGIKAEDYLENNDSYTFFRNVADGIYHIHTGHTETNVMDIVVIVID